jgi:hypothetical protein
MAHPDEGIAEVERDRRDLEALRHLTMVAQRAALDGQTSRNGQYVQASGLGFGV